MCARTAVAIGTVAIAALVILAGTPAVVAGGSNEIVQGEPDLEFTMATSHVEPGERTTVTVAVTNTGQIVDSGLTRFESEVKTARGVTLDVPERADHPYEVKSGPVALGPISDGQTRTATFTIELDEDAPPGTYAVPVTAEYEHTRYVAYDVIDRDPGYRDVDYVTRDESVTEDVSLTVESRPRFEVEPAGTNALTAGDTGTIEFDVRNVGTQTASRARVQLQSKHSAIQFGQVSNPQGATSTYVSSLAPGEATTVTARAIASSEVSPGSYSVTVVVDYEDPNGLAGRSAPEPVGVAVNREQTFSARDVRSTLSVGDDGEVRATVINEGPEDVHNAVVRYRSQSQTITSADTEYAIGTLAAGEETRFAFEFDVSEEAAAGSRMQSFDVQYRNGDGDQRTSEPFDVPIEVGPEEDPFRIESVATTVESGSQLTMELRVTNDGTEPLDDVEATLFADEPLSSDNDEAYVGRLEPGESTTVAFDVGAASGIIEKRYPVSIDFTYEDADGDTELSDTYRVPVTVEEPDDTGLPWPFIIGGALVLVGIGIWRRETIRNLR